MFYGTHLFHLSPVEVDITPFGMMLDLIECVMQYNGVSEADVESTIDDIIPIGV